MLAFIILPPLQCGPDLSVWSAPAKARAEKCTLGNKIILGFCISDLVLETVVIGMPIPLVLRLHASLKRRLAVLFVFLTAFVSFGAVIARLVVVTRILQKQVRDKSESNTTQTFIWILEAGFALIAVNLPTLWWLKQKIQTDRVLDSMRSAMSLHSLRSSPNGTEARTRNAQTMRTVNETKGDTHSLSEFANSSGESFRVAGPGTEYGSNDTKG